MGGASVLVGSNGGTVTVRESFHAAAKLMPSGLGEALNSYLLSAYANGASVFSRPSDGQRILAAVEVRMKVSWGDLGSRPEARVIRVSRVQEPVVSSSPRGLLPNAQTQPALA